MIKRLTITGLLSLSVCLGLKGRVVSAQSLGGISLTSVRPRILTPNADLKNDLAFFTFDETLTGLPIQSAVYDINGSKVGSLQFHSNDVSLTWDGRDDSGSLLPAGIYVYMIEIGKNRATGTVVLAR